MAVNIKQSVSNPISVDIGNRDIQGRVVSKTIQFAMFTRNENAVWAGNQQLLKAGYPFAMVTFPANRNIFRYEVGDAFKFRYAAYGILDMVCRVLMIEEESLETETITVYAMEDIFSVSRAIAQYTVPVNNSIPAPDYTIEPFDHQMVMEAPYVMSETIAILPAACRKSVYDLGFEVYMSMDGGASYLYIGTVDNIVPYGILVGGYIEETYTIDEETGFTIDFENDDVNQLETATWAEVFSAQRNTALLGDEIISFQSITPVSGTQYKLEGIIRGRFGTQKKAHSAGEAFYAINLTASILENAQILAGAARKFKYVPYNVRGVGDIADAVALNLTIEGECLKPYIPINFMANGSRFAGRYYTDIVLTWSARYRGKGAGIGIPGIVISESDREGLFKVEVWVGGIKVRTAPPIDDVTWTYTEAMSLVDNGGLPDSVTFKLSNYRTEGGVLYESDQVTVVCKKNAAILS